MEEDSLPIPEDNTPTNVVDDIKLKGTMGGNTTPTGVNIAYANVEDLEQFIQFDRKAEGNVEKINEIKKTILDKGYLYDTGYEGGVVFGVTVDELGNVQIEEANHRLQALIDVAKETGQEIYVPINPVLRNTSDGNKVQLTSSDNAYNSMKQLLTDMLEDNKNFDLERTINEKLGEPGRKIVQLESYTYPGGAPGTSTTQSNIKKFFNSIGINAITYDELPDNNIYKTGVNTFTDTPTNIIDDKLSTFDTTLNSADGNVEFYIKHQGTQVSANDIRYNPNLGSDTEKFIPGFYGEPVGDVSAKTMGIKIQDNPVSNYYKVQVNTNNLLITQPDGFLGNQIDKVDWNIFAKETGISLSDIKNPKTQNVNSLINELKQLGLDDGTIAEGFRKSGIEGFVELKGDWREVVLIDPNDDLGIGSKLNIEDATEVEFLNNQSKVNQIDELIIKPTNVVDDIPPNQTLKVMEESGLSSHSERIRKVAQDYHKIMGYSDPEFKPAMVFNDEIGAVAADIFEQLPMYDDAAIPYYNKFIKETNMQYQTLLDSGMQFELTDTDPYTPNRAGHTQMINDMENGVLKVLSTEAGFGNEATNAANPMLKNSIYTDINGKVMLENDVFRAVHDTFGHGMRGNTFGPVGEYNAWLAHKEMYSPDARRVMTTETLGQNTYTNYGQHMRDANGNLLSKGDPNYLKPADRPYAPQKVAVMPQDIIETAGKVVDDASELVDVNSLNKVIEIANTNPGVADSLFKSAKNIVGKVFGTAGAIADPGDIAITQGITRILPRLGLAAIAAPALSAYIGYELIVLLADAANAFNVATQNQDVNLLEYNPDVDWKKVGKDTWQEFGEVSDTWSLSWKISEPIIDYAFNEYAKLQENR